MAQQGSFTHCALLSGATCRAKLLDSWAEAETYVPAAAQMAAATDREAEAEAPAIQRLLCVQVIRHLGG